MKRILRIAGLLLCIHGVPATAGQGCLETSTATVNEEICLQLDCQERAAGGGCTRYYCAKTLRKEYIDPSGSGCTRMVNCGRNSVFFAGAPGEPAKESLEICDWRPCVEVDPETGACRDYQCVSMRTIKTERSSYGNALCIKEPAWKNQAPPARAAAASKTAAPRGLRSKPMRPGLPEPAE